MYDDDDDDDNDETSEGSISDGTIAPPSVHQSSPTSPVYPSGSLGPYEPDSPAYPGEGLFMGNTPYPSPPEVQVVTDMQLNDMEL